MDIDTEKAALRAVAKDVRARAFKLHGAGANDRIAGHGIAFADPPAGCVVAGFLPIRDEIDPRPLMAVLQADGFVCALPVMEGKGKPLVFRAWASGEPLNEVAWGIKEPPPTARVLLPDIVLVPLLAFDGRGFRIGYGGGFYDRSIEKLRASKKIVTIGLAFDEQRIEAVVHGEHDEPVDWMLTPSGPTRCTG